MCNDTFYNTIQANIWDNLIQIDHNNYSCSATNKYNQQNNKKNETKFKSIKIILGLPRMIWIRNITTLKIKKGIQ